MQAIVALRSRFELLRLSAAIDLLRSIVNDPLVKAQIEDKVTEQLARGERGDGTKLPNYSPVSVAKFGKPAGPIRLFDQGDFYQGVHVEADAQGIAIDDTDWKTPKLTEIYGDEILTLQERSISELNEDVLIPIFREGVLKYLLQ